MYVMTPKAKKIGRRRSSRLVRPLNVVVHHRVVWLLHYLEKVAPSPACTYALAANASAIAGGDLDESIFGTSAGAHAALAESDDDAGLVDGVDVCSRTPAADAKAAKAAMANHVLCGEVVLSVPMQRRIARGCLRYLERAQRRPRGQTTAAALVTLLQDALARARARAHARAQRTIAARVSQKSAKRRGAAPPRSPSLVPLTLIVTKALLCDIAGIDASRSGDAGLVPIPKGGSALFDVFACVFVLTVTFCTNPANNLTCPPHIL